ncbi:MAG: S41 family peptidase [Alphaproteobacteria bacterium]|nr:S41 family peptidase [Alphaproteobacteria bacterium]
MLKFRHYSILGLLLFTSVACSAQEKIEEVTTPAEETTSVEDITLRNAAIFYASVAKHVQENYVESTTNNELLEGSLRGMLSSLDPHSNYYNPKEYQDLRNQTQGEFGGLGMEVTMEEGLVKVISPMEDTPAFRGGIQPQDLIIKVGSEPIWGMTLNQAVDKLKGKPGTSVTFTVRRGTSSDFDVTLVREIIHVKPVKTKIEGDIGVVRILTFNEDTTQEVIKSIHEIREKVGSKLQGVVIDLRSNAGGLFNQAISVSNLFLNTGRIVSVVSRGETNQAQHIDANPDDMLNGMPLAVLINSGTASSSEIVAGALQDQKRAIVVGTKSFGKGSVQTVIPLSNGGAIKLTTALYYTPNGRSIQKMGIDPDIEIEQAVDLKLLDESSRLRESDFKTALENGNKKVIAPRDPKKVGDEKEEIVDYQLLRAIDILRGINFYKKKDNSAK